MSKVFRRPIRTPGRSRWREALLPTYEEVHALRDVTLQVGEQEFVGYVGPNGAGKSTTMKCFSGILHPDSGSIRLNGIDPVHDRLRFARRVGVVFGQKSLLSPDLPPWDSFALMRRLYDLPRQTFEVLVKSLIEAFDVGAVVTVPVRNLSLGQRMRCEIITALLHSPEVLLLDEPSVGMDFRSKRVLREALKHAQTLRPLSVVLTSHDLEEVDRLCPRLVVIQGGSVVFDGPTETLRGAGSSKSISLRFTDHFDSATLVQLLPRASVQKRAPNELVLFADPNDFFPALHRISGAGELVDLSISAEPLEGALDRWYATRSRK